MCVPSLLRELKDYIWNFKNTYFAVEFRIFAASNASDEVTLAEFLEGHCLQGEPLDINDTIRYDTIGEFNVDSKAEYSALSSTRSQKNKLKQTTPVPL